MKVVSAQEMTRIEQLAYSRGAREEEFMQKAGEGVAARVMQCIAELHLKPSIGLLCGRGNNSGDAYVAGSLLIGGGFQVRAFSCASFDESTPLCQQQSRRFLSEGGTIEYIKSANTFSLTGMNLLIDGIFGTGFRGEVEGTCKTLIEKANESKVPVISIDIPSGINGNTGEIGGLCINALETIFLGLPKTGCFLNEAWNYVGKIHVYNFGLPDECIEEARADFILIDDAMVRTLLPRIVRTRHKYQAGYVVGLGGSPGMPGAAIMASAATLRVGAGIVRLFHPKGMESELTPAPLEVIRQGFRVGEFKAILDEMKRAAAVFIGPGLAISSPSIRLLKKILPQINRPCVIDASALKILAAHPIQLPPQTILTPHHGEMKALLGIKKEIPMDILLEKSNAYAQKNKITLILKGSPTFIFHPGKTPFLCARGDPGMATAGSGDILTGIVAGFLAQTHDPLKAALLGVQFHALAGEIAASKITSYSMTATDLMTALPLVFENYLRYGYI